MSTQRLFLALCGVGLLLAATAAAQPGKCCTEGMPKYDPRTELTVTGTIDRVILLETPMEWKGVHLEMTSDGTPFEVHLGPDFFINAAKIELGEGDEVTIVGSSVSFEGRDVLVAKRITKGTIGLQLRDDRGQPVWAERHRMRRGQT